MVTSLRRRLFVLAAVLSMVTGLATAATAATASIDFEWYSLGSINGQDGWSATGAYDYGVVSNTYAYGSFGSQSFRISNAITSGSFGDWAFSKSLADEAGESNASNGGHSDGTRQPYFEASFDIASTVPTEEQPGLQISTAPDRGDGARMSFLRFNDTSDGIDVTFADYVDAAPQGSAADPGAGCGPEDDFPLTTIAEGLDRSEPHRVKLAMAFEPSPANDSVAVYIDGTLAHVGTSWEDYFRYCEGTLDSRTVDSLILQARSGAGTAVGTLGKGFVIDNLGLESGPLALGGCLTSVSGTTITLLDDCTTDHTLFVPNEFTLDGNGYTVTAIDPAGGHFLGAVVKNAGATANVIDLTVTASGLANVCDGADNRLRGILFEGAAGLISDNVVTGINQGPSGCQEGNGIEIRNAPFDTTGPDLAVTIADNVVSNYQKNGITANGSVAATILDNTVTGVGPVNYIAQNGIQVGFGGTATLSGNLATGNSYTPDDWVACGVLYYQADGVRAHRNTVFGNERDYCNFGKGGGQFNSTAP